MIPKSLYRTTSCKLPARPAEVDACLLRLLGASLAFATSLAKRFFKKRVADRRHESRRVAMANRIVSPRRADCDVPKRVQAPIFRSPRVEERKITIAGLQSRTEYFVEVFVAQQPKTRCASISCWTRSGAAAAFPSSSSNPAGARGVGKCQGASEGCGEVRQGTCCPAVDAVVSGPRQGSRQAGKEKPGTEIEPLVSERRRKWYGPGRGSTRSRGGAGHAKHCASGERRRRCWHGHRCGVTRARHQKTPGKFWRVPFFRGIFRASKCSPGSSSTPRLFVVVARRSRSS